MGYGENFQHQATLI